MALSGDDEHKIFLLLGRIEANQNNTLEAIKNLRTVSHEVPCGELRDFRTKVVTKTRAYAKAVAVFAMFIAVLAGGIQTYEFFFK